MADYQIAPGPQPSGAVFLVHVAAFVLAAVCLAVAGVAGGFYLALHRRLKKPGAFLTTGRYPSLEALEQLNIRAAALGFPLLTIGLWLGMLQIWDQPDRLAWLADAKVICAMIVWLMYAALLHMQHLPTFRGTRIAWLSMLSTVGLLVTFVVSDFVVTKHP
jgi:ABC-type transport system involved in cytochrome c biogenesis permease subunit